MTREPDAIKLTIEETPDKDDLEAFWNILRKYNQEQAGKANIQKLCILLRDSQGSVIGGLNGETLRGWLHVENLAVSDSHRHQGLGSQLLQVAEAEAIRRGCRSSHLDTYSFQALPFYEKHGYKIFGVLNDFPQGYKKIFLFKELA